MKINQNLLLIAATVLLMTICKKKAKISTKNPAAKQKKSSIPFLCDIKVGLNSSPKIEANGSSGKSWTKGRTIKVSFNGGNALVRSKVKQYVKSWEASANLTFQFVEDNIPADIKISLSATGQSWSYIGTNHKNQAVSVNYERLNDNTSEEEFRRVTAHEFSHALGLSHEQLHPDTNI
jgi:serralysin